MAGESGPRSGKNAPKKAASSKGKAKMTQAAWDKLSNRQQERDYGGSRFETKRAKSSGKPEGGHGGGKHGSGRAGFGEGKERQE